MTQGPSDALEPLDNDHDDVFDEEAVHWLTPPPETGATFFVGPHDDSARPMHLQQKLLADRTYLKPAEAIVGWSLIERQLHGLLWRVYGRLRIADLQRPESHEALAIVYLPSAATEVTLNRVKNALRELGCDIIDESEVVHSSIWQAFTLAFKRTVTQEQLEEAGDYALAAARNKVYAENQAVVTKTLAEAVATLLQAMKDEPTGSALVGNLYVAKINGVPFAMELTAAQVRSYHTSVTLQKDPVAALSAFQNANIYKDPEELEQVPTRPSDEKQQMIEQ
ncbi:hypothetical protein GBF35_45790 [Nonomuraea phyllanthi]|uniref:hypothetical protein n=1 Tax=Nonomuraea phyllanthi TaxID=2219224 RepID=UPI0012930ED6|nr:hypothetical protein [Nonomuraea phyllanthi]QFY12906.1 hypothetical protein GBF35_45790 [Nonomuraea phyllanthi]